MANSCVCDKCKVELEIKFKARKDSRRYKKDSGYLQNHTPCMRLSYINDEGEDRSLLQGITTHYCTVCGVRF